MGAVIHGGVKPTVRPSHRHGVAGLEGLLRIVQVAFKGGDFRVGGTFDTQPGGQNLKLFADREDVTHAPLVQSRHLPIARCRPLNQGLRLKLQ